MKKIILKKKFAGKTAKKCIAWLLTAVAVTAPLEGFAKSNSLIDGNIAKMRKLLYENSFETYRESRPEESVYDGVKFEPRSGTYLGTPYNCQFDGITNAVNTEYEWFEPSDSIKNEYVAREEIPEVASSHKELVGVNWNFASQTSVNMSEYSNYIYNFIDRLAARGKDIILIFGKEMNIDDNFLDEDVFINAFRFVADYAHTKNNIAMCWSPNDTGGLDTQLIDFWPGSDYVDWIGCSLYSMPYFQGNPNASDSSNIGFIMGKYANPLMRAKVIANFMEEYGITKPVFITEGGVGYETPGGEQYIDWAGQQLRKYYGDIVRVYPRFKAIVSFNNYVASGDYYRYDFGSNPTLLKIMQKLASDKIYITDYEDKSSSISYTPVEDNDTFYGEISLSASAYVTASDWLRVKYYIDGTEVNSTLYPPYEKTLTSADISYGWHELKTEYLNNGEICETQTRWIDFEPEYYYRDEADSGKNTFSDMGSYEAEPKNAAAELSELGIMTGVGDGSFNAEGNITRAELAAVILRLKGIDYSNSECDFADVSKDNWFYGVAGAAKEAGIITGYEDNTFRGNECVTKNQLTVMLARLLKTGGSGTLAFVDTVPDWVRESALLLSLNGVLLARRDNYFDGDQYVTRAATAVMVNRLTDCIE